MNLGLWTEAIKDFQESLEVNPKSLLAEFSIGECYLRLDDYRRAKEQFEKAIAIDPTNQSTKDFLKKVNDLLECPGLDSPIIEHQLFTRKVCQMCREILLELTVTSFNYFFSLSTCHNKSNNSFNKNQRCSIVEQKLR